MVCFQTAVFVIAPELLFISIFDFEPTKELF